MLLACARVCPHTHVEAGSHWRHTMHILVAVLTWHEVIEHMRLSRMVWCRCHSSTRLLCAGCSSTMCGTAACAVKSASVLQCFVCPLVFFFHTLRRFIVCNVLFLSGSRRYANLRTKLKTQLFAVPQAPDTTWSFTCCFKAYAEFAALTACGP